MRSCAQTQPKSLSRGMWNHVFTDHDNKYYSIGAQPGRAEAGVQSGLYKMEHGFPNHHWDCIHKVLKCAEYAFNMFMDTEVIQHIVQARGRVKLWMMEPSPSGLHAKSARYYNAVGFGINVFLRCHIDKDFTMSIVQIHLDEIMYQNNDQIVCFLLSLKLEFWFHCDLEILIFSIRRNHIVYLCAAIKMTIFIVFHLIWKHRWWDSMTTVIRLY